VRPEALLNLDIFSEAFIDTLVNVLLRLTLSLGLNMGFTVSSINLRILSLNIFLLSK